LCASDKEEYDKILKTGTGTFFCGYNFTAAAFFLTRASAKAQGLIEYAVSFQVSRDYGAPVIEGMDVVVLEDHFGITSWPEDYGLIVTCMPRFQLPPNQFTKLEVCATVYQDLDDSHWLSPFGTQQDNSCETIKF
jgi:hypothetical protein